jgi:hypothetical protein
LIWQYGLIPGLAACFGLILMVYEIFKYKKHIHLYLLSWVGLWFFVQSTQFVKAGRYLSIIYPFIALLSAYFLLFVFSRLEKRFPGRRIRHIPWIFVVSFSFLWSLAFTSIYSKPHTRVAASYWIYENIPCGATIANEHWDDGLPLRVGGKDGYGGCYKGLEFNHFWIDSRVKLDDTLTKINQADYIILSSNRIYGSLPRLPKRFPFTLEYFRMLFSGELGFDLVKRFRSNPSLFGVEFNTDYAEEPFTVYDHPKVFIFKKDSSRFNLEKIKERLSSFPDGVHEPLI